MFNEAKRKPPSGQLRAIKKPRRQIPGGDKSMAMWNGYFIETPYTMKAKKSRKTNENRHFTHVKSMRRQHTL